jgi:RES domain-containing protein
MSRAERNLSGPFHRHPRFAELRDQFRAHPEWFTPWTGTVFRFHTVDYPMARDVLSGKGAAGRGGRWNPPGLHTIYGSTTDTTALEECKANDLYYGVVNKSPRLLVAIEAHLTRALDLTGQASGGHWTLALPNWLPKIGASCLRRGKRVSRKCWAEPRPRLAAAGCSPAPQP